MSSADFLELSADEEIVNLSRKTSRRKLDSVVENSEPKQNTNTKSKKVCWKSSKQQEPEANISSVAISTSQNGSSVSDHGPSPVAESNPSPVPAFGPPPICRQFWKAGNYDIGEGSKTQRQTVAELLDNAVDEIRNGATFVVIDKTINPRDGNPALLILDDGGGMDPKTIRCCMSFGFSDKKAKSSIGQYGNGFKTSSMRLGADAIVFTRCLKKRTPSQSVGLLSYTFLRQSGHGRIVVPLVDYEFNPSTGKSGPIFPYGREHFSFNLSVLLQWSPYSTEEMLLKQFDDIGHHGTKIVIYNLWLNNNGVMELNFDFDAEDIRVNSHQKNADQKLLQTDSLKNQFSDNHIANLYHFSLRVYSSILYLKLPQGFKIILRGRVVEHRNIADDLKFHEFILYKPLGRNMEAAVVTTIGFLKDAPHVNIHGFNVYHKNRLILPFWRVKYATNGTGRGVVGILEANFIEPTHDKQDFEKTSVFQKLEARLKAMTMEYWRHHCGLIGYKLAKNTPKQLKPSHDPPLSKGNSFFQPLVLNQRSSVSDNAQTVSSTVDSFEDVGATTSYVSTGRTEKSMDNHNLRCWQGPKGTRKEQDPTVEFEHGKSCVGSGFYSTDTHKNGIKQAPHSDENPSQEEEFTRLMQENKKLRLRLLELERVEEDLNLEVEQLSSELCDLESEYARMLSESEAMDMEVRNEDE